MKSILAKVMDKEVPKTLYHYTSSAGLNGIIETEKIWATKIHYLNDSSELRLALDYLREEIEMRKKTGNTAAPQDCEDLLSALSDMDQEDICVASFSEKGDQLSQWRGYTNLGDGYSLGFDGETLKTLAERQYPIPETTYYLFPCQYDNEIHKQLVAEVVDLSLKDNNKDDWHTYRNQGDPRAFWVHSFVSNALTVASIIKSQAFEEEKEWRLISTPLPYREAKFRRGKYSLIPYWEFRLDINKSKVIRKIIIGPSPEQKLSIAALEKYLVCHLPYYTKSAEQGVEFTNTFSLESSSIPFRSM